MFKDEKIVRRVIRKVLLREYADKYRSLLLEAENDYLFPGMFADGGKQFSDRIRKEFLKNKKIAKIARNKDLSKKDKKEAILAAIHKIGYAKREFERSGQPTKYKRHSNFRKYIDLYIDIQSTLGKYGKEYKFTKKNEETVYKKMQDDAESRRDASLGRNKKKKDEPVKKTEPTKTDTKTDKRTEEEKLDVKSQADALKERFGSSSASKGNRLIGEIQRILNSIKYTDHNGKKLKEDKQWGKRTRAALSKFLYNNSEVLVETFKKELPKFRKDDLKRAIRGLKSTAWKNTVRYLTDEKLSYLAAVVVLDPFKVGNAGNDKLVSEADGPAKSIKPYKGKTKTKGAPEAASKGLTDQEKEELVQKLSPGGALGTGQNQSLANQTQTSQRGGVQGILDKQEEIKRDPKAYLRKIGFTSDLINNPPDEQLVEVGPNGGTYLGAFTLKTLIQGFIKDPLGKDSQGKDTYKNHMKNIIKLLNGKKEFKKINKAKLSARIKRETAASKKAALKSFEAAMMSIPLYKASKEIKIPTNFKPGNVITYNGRDYKLVKQKAQAATTRNLNRNAKLSKVVNDPNNKKLLAGQPGFDKPFSYLILKIGNTEITPVNDLYKTIITQGKRKVKQSEG